MAPRLLLLEQRAIELVEGRGSAEGAGAERGLGGMGAAQQSRNRTDPQHEIGPRRRGELRQRVTSCHHERAEARAGVVDELVNRGTQGVDGAGWTGASGAGGVGPTDEWQVGARTVGGRER